jgi:hypothetical protein
LPRNWRTEDVRDLKSKKIVQRACEIANAEQLFQFHSSKEITAFDCFLSATVKIQRGNFKKLLNSLWGPA